MAIVAVSAVFGVLLVWLALRALRRGSISLPGTSDAPRTLNRGEPWFVVVVLVLLGGGVWAIVNAVGAAHALLNPDAGRMRTERGPGFVIQVPERWQATKPEGDLEAMTFVHPRGELTVIFSNAEVRADALETLAEGVRDPSIGYSQFEVERRPGELEVRMRYPAPRGEVIGRLVAKLDPNHRLRTAHAMCSFDSDSFAPTCEQVVRSLTLE
jgi:hypothetical protein